MVPKILALAVVAVIFTSFSAFGAPVHVSGNWEASGMGARLVVQIQQNGSQIGGVAYVHEPMGNVNTYHFTGKVDGNKVTAFHHSGHSFVGTALDGNHLKGTLTSKDGHRIPVDLSRR